MKKRVLQLRATENEKGLIEQRAELYSSLQELTSKVEMEKRAFSEEEDKTFKETEEKIKSIDKTLDMIQRARNVRMIDAPTTEDPADDIEEVEIRAFANIIRERADSNITKTDNGAIIPKTVVNKIIDKVKDISPLFRDATKYNIKGTVSIPYVDESNDNITVAYATEFTDLEAKSTKLLSVDLVGYLAGALAKISVSLLNSTDIELVDFVVGKLGIAVADFMDHEILVGTNNKITGLSTATQIITAAAQTAITADELIRLQGKLKSAFQRNAYFVMHPDTLTAIKLLKDKNDRYLFNEQIKDGFSGTILGKPVYTSDQCPGLSAGAKAIFYLDAAEALSAKLVEDYVQILKEKYATQHAIGVVAWCEADAKISNQQAVAVLQMAASNG
ncbi:MAG: phage major capsid protein [Butyrivibrio sp.]|uniref:phage major capsid protein n=1 Tax=Butyrivibrio sp. TaxID=28121 RepID=UPI001B7BF9F1|nr:phage major capsid protein [Butyrivibrio sp.]MBP3784594.1 phage major capsid protein [Butyrivibrio sp.]